MAEETAAVQQNGDETTDPLHPNIGRPLSHPPSPASSRLSSIEDIHPDFSDSESQQVAIPMPSETQRQGHQPRPRAPTPEGVSDYDVEIFPPRETSLTRQRTQTTTVSDSTEASSSVRREGSRAPRRRVDEDSDEDQPNLSPSQVGIQRGTLLRIATSQDEPTDTSNDRGSGQARMKSEPLGRGTPFLDSLGKRLDELHEEQKYFLLIIEGPATSNEIDDLERIAPIQGIKRLLRKQMSARQLPSSYDEGLIFDTPFLHSTGMACIPWYFVCLLGYLTNETIDISAVRYIRVWIPKATKLFAVLFDPRVGLQSLQDTDQAGGDSILPNILYHFRSTQRWSRYEKYRMWLVIDLYSSLFIEKWNERYNELAEQVEKDREKTIQHFTKAPITLLSFSLHQGQSNLLSLLELKRYQEAVFQRIELFLDNIITKPSDIPSGFRFRIRSMVHQEGLTQRAIDLLLKKVDDTINLLFNITAVNEARAINRLTYLAFVFVPLSFATSVWGMTEFQIAAKWVTAFALPLLTVTAVAAWLSNIVARRLDTWKMERMKRVDTNAA